MVETAVAPARTDVAARLRRFAVCSAAGLAAGFLVGGVGGRLAMLLLRLTSDPYLHGLKTDDGFTIGVVSGDTMFLLTFTAILGAIQGATYFLGRTVLPERSGPWIWGAFGCAVGGSAILRPDGIDFTLLEPQLLAVSMFIAIPAGGAAATGLLAERWLARGPRSFAWFLALVPVLLFAAAGPTALMGIVVMVVLVLAMPIAWIESRSTVPRPVVIGGRLVITAVGALAGVALVRDVLEIL